MVTHRAETVSRLRRPASLKACFLTVAARCGRTARARRSLVMTAMLALWTAACAAPANVPSNAPLRQDPAPAARLSAGVPARTGVILAFSGGGARSAAFGYGVLSALAEQPSPGDETRRLVDDIGVVAGVSGGAILAAHLALHGPRALPEFRRAFLDQDAEASLRMAYTPENLLRAYHGGVNDLSGLAAWLDASLYGGATMGDLGQGGRPRLLLHATDLYNRAPFPFDRASFRSICSDYDSFPLAHAVAASSAVPVAFAPVVLQNFTGDCPVARNAPAAARLPGGSSQFDRHVAESQARYASAPDLHYLKLLDGGLVDNLAVRNLIRSLKQPAPEPLGIAAARHLERLIIIVADASTRVGGEMSNAVEGPTAPSAIVAAADAMIDSASRMSLDALEGEAAHWRDRLVRWRCSAAGAQAGCGRLDVSVVRLSLADASGQAEKARILQLHNTLSLKSGDVDFLAGLGRSLLLGNESYRSFIKPARHRGVRHG